MTIEDHKKEISEIGLKLIQSFYDISKNHQQEDFLLALNAIVATTLKAYQHFYKDRNLIENFIEGLKRIENFDKEKEKH